MDGLPPASAAIFTSYLYHSTTLTDPRRRRRGIRRQPPMPRDPCASLDAHAIAILDAAPRPDESARFAVTRREAELVALFATLTVAESRRLRERLLHPKTDDPLAPRLARLPCDARERLLEVLATARCRQPD